MRTNFNNYDAAYLLETVESDLGLNLYTSCQRTEFNLPGTIGDGAIATYLFQDGLSLFLFNGTLYKDWEWEFSCEEDSPAFIFFSLSGEIEDAKKGETERFVLKPMNTLMVVQPGGSSRSMIFKKDKPISLAVLRIDHKRFFHKKACCHEDIPEKLRALLSLPGTEIEYLLPPNRRTVEVVQLIKEMMDCKYEGLVRTCTIEAKSRQLLALYMQRIADGFKENNDNARLVGKDMQKMEEAKEILIRDLCNPPTIEELSRKIGLNRQKLKQDFKLVFEKTIYQYLISERMIAAKKMMMKEPVSIGEVAANVGYGNASHFSKRFKEHFGLLPSKFLFLFWRSGQDN